MRVLAGAAGVGLLLVVGCTSSPRSQDMVRRSTAAVTRAVASDLKGAALGVADGLKHDPNRDPVDVNQSPEKVIESLPGVTEAMAHRIVENRPYKKPSDLVKRHILPKSVYGKVSSRLIAH